MAAFDLEEVTSGMTPQEIGDSLRSGRTAKGRTEMKAITGLTAGDVVYLSEGGRSGTFETLPPGDYSAEIAADPLEGVYVLLDDGQTLKRRLNGYVTPEMFGAAGDNSADDVLAVQASWDFSATYGYEARGTFGKTYRHDSELYFKNGMSWDGKWCRIEKNFTTVGTNAGIRSVTLDGVIANGTQGGYWKDTEIGASDYEILGVRTNKLILFSGENFRFGDIKVNKWSGWAITWAGNNVHFGDVDFRDPFDAAAAGLSGNGVDGLHQVGGELCTVGNVTGVTGDDLVAIATALTGSYADKDIKNTTIESISGQSLYARVALIGLFDETHTAICSDITVGLVSGVGSAESVGTLSIQNISESGGLVENITVNNHSLDSTDCKAGVDVRCAVPTDPADTPVFRNINVLGGRVYGAGEYGVRTLGRVTDSNIQSSVDASGLTSNAFIVSAPKDSIGNKFDIDIYAPQVQPALVSGASDYILDSEININVYGVPTGQRAFSANSVSNCDIKVYAEKATGATGTEGISEGVFMLNNRWSGSNVSDMDTPVVGSQAGSDWSNVKGYVTESEGIGAVIPSGSTSLVVNHGCDFAPSRSEISVTPTNNSVKQKFWAITAVSSTTFTISIDSDPLAGGWSFDWHVKRAVIV